MDGLWQATRDVDLPVFVGSGEEAMIPQSPGAPSRLLHANTTGRAEPDGGHPPSRGTIFPGSLVFVSL